MTDIITFCKTRIIEDKDEATFEEGKPRSEQKRTLSAISKHYRRHKPRKVIRQSDCLLATVLSVEAGVAGMVKEQGQDALVDNEFLVSLVLIANIWREHPDFKLFEWFPTILEGSKFDNLKPLYE